MAVNDVFVEIETAKSLVELPSPFAGMVPSCWAEGQTLEVGTPLFTVDATVPGTAQPAPPRPSSRCTRPAAADTPVGPRTPVPLVGPARRPTR